MGSKAFVLEENPLLFSHQSPTHPSPSRALLMALFPQLFGHIRIPQACLSRLEGCEGVGCEGTGPSGCRCTLGWPHTS